MKIYSATEKDYLIFRETSKEENIKEIQNEIDELEKLIALKTKLLEEKKKQEEME